MKRRVCESLAIIAIVYIGWCGAEPHIAASVYPRYTDRITTDSTIALDLRLSYDDDDLPLYFTIESFDDDGPPFLAVHNSTQTMHYFSLHSTGLKRIKITATNAAFGEQTLTASGRASPFKTKAFFVEKKLQSYLYRSSEKTLTHHGEIISITYPSTSTRFLAILPIRVWDPEINSLEEAKFLTNQLADYGETPNISLSDSTLNIDNVQYNETLKAWTATISGKASINAITVTVTKSSLLGDPVQETRITISLFPLLEPLWPVQTNVTSDEVLRTGAPLPTRSQITCHPCSRLACVEFSPSHIIATRDRFVTSKDFSVLIPGTILDARFALEELVVATNESLFVLSLTSPNTISRVLNYTATHAVIGSISQCPIPDMVKRTSFIFLSAWNGTVNDPFQTYSCQAKSCRLMNLSNSILATPISLPNRNITFSLIRAGGNFKSLITNSYTSISQTGFIFEGHRKNSSVPVITPFAYGHGLFVFIDDTLWIARDDGQYFTTISFPGPKPKSIQITSSSTSTAFAINDLTNDIAYCGRTSLDFVIPCYIGNSQSSSNMYLWFDSSDLLHLTYINSKAKRLHIFIPRSSYIGASWLRRFTSVKFLPSAVNTFLVPIPSYSGFASDPRYLLVDRWNTSLQEWAYDIDMGYLQLSGIDSSSSPLGHSSLSHSLFGITNFDLSVTVINSSAVVLHVAGTFNQIVNGTSEGWLQAHLFCTVWIKDAVFLINRYINATQIGAAVIIPASAASRLSSAAGDWKIWDSRPYRNEAVVGQQSLQLMTTSYPSYFRLSLSSGTFSFKKQFVGQIVVLDAIWGVITSFISTQTVECALGANSPQLQGNRTYQAGEWSMIATDVDADLSFMPDISRIAKRSFALNIPACPYDDRAVVKPSSYQHLDLDESANVSIFLPEYKSKPQLSLFGIQSSNAMVQLQTASFDDDLGVNGVKVSLTFTDVGTCNNCIATAIFGTKSSSMQCNPASLPTFSHFIMGCPPGKAIILDMAQINTNMLTLPINYRSPSALGLGVPISPNIYNADPNKTRTEFMRISQITGKYKNCTGLGTDSCICTTSGGSMTPITQTDCIQEVPEAAYGDLFKVPVLILDGDEAIATCTEPFKIIELNGRDDFCTSVSTTCLINTSPYIIDQSQNAGIRWSGEGLYHFRIVVLQGSYCELSTEFLVFVTNPPLQTAVETFVIAMTAMLIGIALLIGYAYKNSQLQRAIRHRAAFVLNKQYFTKLKAL